MDIQRLRQILKELRPIFWNDEINHDLHKRNYPYRTPIESAEWRYEIAMKKVNHKGTKQHFDQLFKEVEKCLTPYDRIFDVLRKEFTSSFAEQVLLSNEKIIKDFIGVTTDNFWQWMSFMVCMSHEDFWADLARTKPAKTKQKTSSLKSWASNFFWTLYEKTLKIVIDAVLEKMRHN